MRMPPQRPAGCGRLLLVCCGVSRRLCKRSPCCSPLTAINWSIWLTSFCQQLPESVGAPSQISFSLWTLRNSLQSTQQTWNFSNFFKNRKTSLLFQLVWNGLYQRSAMTGWNVILMYQTFVTWITRCCHSPALLETQKIRFSKQMRFRFSSPTFLEKKNGLLFQRKFKKRRTNVLYITVDLAYVIGGRGRHCELIAMFRLELNLSLEKK